MYVFNLSNNRLLVNDLPRFEPLVEVGVRTVGVDLLVGRTLREVEAAALDGLDELAHALLLQVLLAHFQEDLGNAGLSGWGRVKRISNPKTQNSKFKLLHFCFRMCTCSALWPRTFATIWRAAASV